MHQHNRFEPPFEFKIEFYESILLDPDGVDNKETRSITIAIKKIVLTITAELPVIIPKPNTPVTNAIAENKIALRTIHIVYFRQELDSIAKKSCRLNTA
ncbi:MAG TPA: hypothetical protein VJ765_02590 [Chitinophagaceae bacterium]|nr:hypothetical protein [Chitinophagaceae bacterium]